MNKWKTDSALLCGVVILTWPKRLLKGD